MTQEDTPLWTIRIQQADETLQDCRTLRESQGSTRSVVNRAYYAAFYAVLALLAHSGLKPRKHSQAISQFDQHFVRMGLFPKEASRGLCTLFQLRNENDYQEGAVISPAEVEDACKQAEAIVASAKAYLDSQDPE